MPTTFPEPPDEPICPICSDEPVTQATSCKHLFCGACYNTWFDAHQNCPICRRLNRDPFDRFRNTIIARATADNDKIQRSDLTQRLKDHATLYLEVLSDSQIHEMLLEYAQKYDSSVIVMGKAHLECIRGYVAEIARKVDAGGAEAEAEDLFEERLVKLDGTLMQIKAEVARRLRSGQSL